jgi:hypothetical protein
MKRHIFLQNLFSQLIYHARVQDWESTHGNR